MAKRQEFQKLARFPTITQNTRRTLIIDNDIYVEPFFAGQFPATLERDSSTETETKQENKPGLMATAYGTRKVTRITNQEITIKEIKQTE